MSFLVALAFAQSASDALMNFDPHKALTGQAQSTNPTTTVTPPSTQGSTVTTPSTATVTNTTAQTNSSSGSTDSNSSGEEQSGSGPVTWTIGVSCGAVVLVSSAYYVYRKKKKSKNDLEAMTISSKSTSFQSSMKSPNAHMEERIMSPDIVNSPTKSSPLHFQIKNVESYELDQEKKIPSTPEPNTMFSVTPTKHRLSEDPSDFLSDSTLSPADTVLITPKSAADTKKNPISIASTAYTTTSYVPSAFTESIEETNYMKRISGDSIVSITSSKMSDMDDMPVYRKKKTNIGKTSHESVCSSNQAFSVHPISPNLL
eukprot:NODE_276_length_10970_cov_0.627909.p3 type:complete len:315 gc:universal NODE_276_length_10970_cov_0.627909:10528-9584(-)